MTKPIDNRVLVPFSKWCEKYGYFQDSEFVLVKIDGKVNPFLRIYEGEYFEASEDEEIIGPAPTKEELRDWLEKRNWFICPYCDNSDKYFMNKIKGPENLITLKTKWPNEQRALQEACRKIGEKDELHL